MALISRNHDILEITRIPRERNALAALIGEARAARRRSRRIRWLALALTLVGILILAL